MKRRYVQRAQDTRLLYPDHHLGKSGSTTAYERVHRDVMWTVGLVAFHEVAPGTHFGGCLRTGAVAEEQGQEATHVVSRRFMRQLEHAVQAGCLSDEDMTTLNAAYDLMPAFDNEPPIPCHRDYCVANWLINEDSAWVGVIDFEFSAWDVRVADFSRDPHWSWIGRPDLWEAFFEGYGWSPTPTEEQQLLIAHAEYALSAIV